MEIFFSTINTILLSFTLYYIIISFFGIFRRYEDYSSLPSSRFAVVVAAHNEERVIGELIQNLLELNYPKELYDIYVVADNCTDDTSKVAKEAGIIVLERFSKEYRGKPYALEFAFNKIFKSNIDYDAVVVFDADNLLNNDFLLVMNAHLLKGEKIIQGYLDTKNPCDTWITKSIYISYVLTNRFLQTAKYNLGLSCSLGGTGMCISVDMLKKYGWGMTSLTEDLEFQIKALLNNIKVTWAHEAKIYDEKPLTLMQSCTQRRRWMQGHINVAGRHMVSLIREGIRTKNFAMIDGALYLGMPFLLIITGLNIIGIIYFMQNNIFIDYEWAIWCFLAQFLYLGLGLALERVKPIVYLWLIFYPLYALTWIPVSYVGFVMQNKKEWSHTIHIRNIKRESLENFYLPSKRGR